MRKETYSVGVQIQEIGGITMKIFSSEKTIADCFKFRTTVGLDVALEALKAYLARRGTKPSQLLPMARVCRVETIVRSYLEALI